MWKITDCSGPGGFFLMSSCQKLSEMLKNSRSVQVLCLQTQDSRVWPFQECLWGYWVIWEVSLEAGWGEKSPSGLCWSSQGLPGRWVIKHKALSNHRWDVMCVHTIGTPAWLVWSSLLPVCIVWRVRNHQTTLSNPTRLLTPFCNVVVILPTCRKDVLN